MLSTREKCMRASMRVGLKTFPLRFKNVPTARALEILTALGRGNEPLWWVSFNDPATRFVWTVDKFNATGIIAKTFPLARAVANLEFYGGPPGSTQLHKGTLLSLLIDRLLCIMDNVGFKALDAIVPLSESYTVGGKAWH